MDMVRILSLLIMAIALQGCGLAFDAIRLVWPIATDEVDAICHRQQLHVGVAIEPFRPFVFPATWTDEGPKVTGLDIELTREITAALSRQCGNRAITPIIHLVRFPDLFIELYEGKLDFFVSAVSANLPSPSRAGLAYSIAYFTDAGVGGIVRRPEASEHFRAQLNHGRQSYREPIDPAHQHTLTIAVQEETAAHLYAASALKGVRLVLCDSLPAAFEAGDPAPDVILGSQPILDFLVRTVRTDWQPILSDSGRPLLLMREEYAVVVAEESYRLRWIINDLLFRLWESGRAGEMRRRWFVDDYAYPRRATTEGLPFTAEQVVQHYDQGRCRLAEP